MTQYFVDQAGNYLGGFDGATPPKGATEVSAPPQDGRQKLVNGAWSTPASVVESGIVAATQARLDTFAQTRNYDGILSACTYAGSTNAQFAKEGTYCVAARDNTWNTLYTILAQVQAGNWPTTGAGKQPSGYSDIEASLPALAWPA